MRIYKPGVKLRSAVDARRHRLFTEEDIERLGLGFNDMLVRSLTRSWTQDDEDVVDVLDVASRARRQRNAELRRRLDELTKASEKRAREGLKRDRGLEESATIDELRKLLEERDQTIYKLEGEANLWQGIAEEYANDLEAVTANTDKKHASPHEAGRHGLGVAGAAPARRYGMWEGPVPRVRGCVPGQVFPGTPWHVEARRYPV